MLHLRFLCSLTLLFSIEIMAWPTALDWNADTVGNAADRNKITVDSADIARCDAAIVSVVGAGVIEDTVCHRYGLVWQPAIISGGLTLDLQVDWNPELTANEDTYRLPTIKELIRIFDYDQSDSIYGITDPLIKYWIDNKCTQDSTESTASCLIEKVALTDDSVVEKDSYLISSTYANIDGADNKKSVNNSNVGPFAQVYGIRLKDGKVVLFEFGGKGGVFNGHANKNSMLALCLGLITDGVDTENQEITGGCDYRVNGNDDGTYKHAADLSIVPVFALLVKDTP